MAIKIPDLSFDFGGSASSESGDIKVDVALNPDGHITLSSGSSSASTKATEGYPGWLLPAIVIAGIFAWKLIK